MYSSLYFFMAVLIVLPGFKSECWRADGKRG
jgi:hypothetical protein